jgi:hypothetical protein
MSKGREIKDIGGQWTILKPFELTFKFIVDTGGINPFCMFDIAVSYAPEYKGIVVELAVEADAESVEWFPHVHRGMLRGLETAQEDGRELVGIHIVVTKIYTHEIATTECACERNGNMFIHHLCTRLTKIV